MAGSAGRAKGYGGEAIGKADAFTGEAVHSRCVDEGMPCTSHAVVSLVVTHGKEDVGLSGHRNSPEGVDRWSMKKFIFLIQKVLSVIAAPASIIQGQAGF